MTLPKMGNKGTKAARADGWWYPWVFVGGFVIVAAVNAVMITIALTSWTGLETENYFKKGTGFNEVILEREQQEKLGWQPKLTFAPSGETGAPYGGLVTIVFHDVGGPVEGLNISAMAMRPTHEGMDRAFTFQEQGQGAYSATLNVPLRGQWELRVKAERGDDIFNLRQRIQVP